MPLLELYEPKVLYDEELPIALNINRCDEPREIFNPHWHEHIELHHIIQGSAIFQIDQQQFSVREGDILIANRNELHTGYCTRAPYVAQVIIVDPSDLSKELGRQNYRFTSLIRSDDALCGLLGRIFDEAEQQQPGYRQLCRALVTELLVHLFRYQVADNPPEREILLRQKALKRLEPVLHFIEWHFPERLTVEQLAKMLCLSEDRFGHLFREGVGRSPLQYINEIRLSKAMTLLKTDEYTVTEVAEAVGFSDYNHFGRLFRKRYGCTPNQARRGKFGDEEKNSGNV